MNIYTRPKLYSVAIMFFRHRIFTQNSIKKGILDKESIIESLVSFKRSGASAIVTYFALEIAKQL